MKLSLLALMLLSGVTGFSQNCVVANRKSMPFYVGIDNSLIVSVDGYKMKDIEVVVDNGKVSRESNEFRYNTDSAGKATFTVYKLVKGKKIEVASFIYQVKKLFPPNVILSISGKNQGQINRSQLEMQEGVASYYECDDCGIVCFEGIKPQLQSYRLIIMRNDTLVFSQESNSARFTEEAKTIFKTLVQGDKLYLVSVKIKVPSGVELFIKPFELEVVTAKQSSECTSE
jgi:gliding motility-associated GldM-like protein